MGIIITTRKYKQKKRKKKNPSYQLSQPE